jgi:hypothetical protein
MFRNVLKPIYSSVLLVVMTHLGDDLCRLTKVYTAWKRRPGEKVLNQSSADIVAPVVSLLDSSDKHLIQLFIHLPIVLIVLDELYYERAVREGE